MTHPLTATDIIFAFFLSDRHSLYAKGRVLGFKRAKRNQRPDISLIQIEGVKTAADTDFYLGKRIAFVYRAKREVNGSKIRCIWGRITRAHGGSGAVKARFRNNLPAKSFGASVRVVSFYFIFRLFVRGDRGKKVGQGKAWREYSNCITNIFFPLLFMMMPFADDVPFQV